MPTILKQTSKQAKAEYRKNGGRPSESQNRRLESHAAKDRKAEELKKKEKKKKEAKKRREEKERKEKEARRANGIGYATQACGYKFTQHRQKDWFRSYLQKAQPKPAPELKPEPEDANPFRSSQLSQLEAAEEQCGQPDDAVCNDASEDDLPDDDIRNEVNEVDDADKEDQNCQIALSLEPTPRNSTSYPHNPADENDVDGLSDTFTQAIKNSESVFNAAFGSDDDSLNPWSTDDIDEEALMAAVQGQTPTSKASIAAPAEEVDDLPSMDAELVDKLASGSDLQVARDPATSANCQPCATSSDSFFSSELDLSAEDLAAIDAMVPEAQPTPSKVRVPDQQHFPSVAPQPKTLNSANTARPALDLLPTTSAKQAQKRKADVLDNHELFSPTQRVELTAKGMSADSSMLPPQKPNTSTVNHTSATGPYESRFAAYGLSTQLIHEAAFEDDDF
ncbi:hypothetical protein DIS24_g231 [Lasiodiplodia hormozganensis]|uniref:Uncharacterized protein n=1 Tax=Lasiodiplodia hormozganensis TaxID=869390 RepID=A0AA40D6J0_9PEZI|nr:hypothetical protein DIS24_g231 [Lasiodiplodia hormozganensis]